MKRADHTIYFREAAAAISVLESLSENTGVEPELQSARMMLKQSIGMLSSIVTELIQSERAMSERERELTAARAQAELERRHYQQLFEGSPDGYIVTDNAGKILEANVAAAELLGVSSLYLLGKPLVAFFPQPYRSEMRTLLVQVRNSDPRTYLEWDLQPRSAPLVKVAIAISPERDESGRVLSIRWLLRDVGVQVRVREELRRLNRQNRLLLDSVGEGIFGVDMEGRATFVNPAAERMLGWKADEFIGRYFEELLNPSADDETASEEPSPLSAALRAGTVQRSDGNFFERKDGVPFPVEYICTPIVEDRRVVGTVVAFRDITVRKATQERIRMMNEELERRVAERTAELEEANRQKDLLLESERAARAEAEHANRVKDDFIAIVSHELKTPLTTIKTFTDLLLRNPVPKDERAEYLSVISVECDRQISLVQNMLDIASIEARGYSISITRIDIETLVRSCLGTTLRMAARAGQNLVVELEYDLPPVRGDEFALRRVVTNLLENAQKYTPDGGTITIAASAHDRFVEIRVRDTGRGIPEKDLSRIFDKFYRVNEATKSSDVDTARGVGLGLYLSRLLTERIGGRLTVESSTGKGSTFRLQLARWKSSNGNKPRGYENERTLAGRR